MRALAGVRRIRVTASFCDAAATVAGNRAGLHRLFLVLLDNALKFSHEGGEVIVTVERDGGRAFRSAIEDFGAGISETELPNIFRRFYRFEVTAATAWGLRLRTASRGRIGPRSKCAAL